MSKKEIIIGIVAIVSLVITFALAKVSKDDKGEQHECNYNDMTGCYGMCCNFCQGKNECNWNCEGDHSKCGGYSLRK